MDTKNYSFNIFNDYAKNGIAQAIAECNTENKLPIIVCVGSDLVLGDSLGPLTGTFLKQKDCNAYIYGTLNLTVSAREVNYAKNELKKMHPNSFVIAIDAAVGKSEDIGIIRVINEGLRPGKGVDKDLGVLGDLSIIGVVSSRSKDNYNLFNLTRLNLVYKMASVISTSISEYISFFENKRKDMLLSEFPTVKNENL